MLLSACSLSFQMKHTIRSTVTRYISKSHQISPPHFGCDRRLWSSGCCKSKSTHQISSESTIRREAWYSIRREGGLFFQTSDESNARPLQLWCPRCYSHSKSLWISLNLKPQVFPTAFLCRNWKSFTRLRPASAVAKSWLLQPLLTLHMHVPMPRKGAMAMGHLCGSSHGDHW